MSYYESANYFWNSQYDWLGEGAFGNVYRGTHKKTGNQVAIKTFKVIAPAISKEVKLLQTLKHKYLVGLICVECEDISGRQILVMELCNGGNLTQFLHEPENINGLMDDDFLLVVEHLSNGLDYLRKHNVIHRDIKPDNIMRHIHDDGCVVYKLTDFGAARELPEGENYNSLCGTKPYLHPQIFKACLFGDHNHIRNFGANTELWSIGVTFFQIATGNLPFRAHNCSGILAIFEEIERNEGIISGFQKQNGRFHFRKCLPETSRLSLGLKQLITPIIAGLFRYGNHVKEWTFARYYDEILELNSRRVINVFYVNEAKLLKVYMKPNDNFYAFQDYVSRQTDISIENQAFFCKQILIMKCPPRGEFNFDFNSTIFLFNKSSNTIESQKKWSSYQSLITFRSEFMNLNFANTIDRAGRVSRDLSLLKQQMHYESKIYGFFDEFIANFKQYCENELQELRLVFSNLSAKRATVSDMATILEKLQQIAHLSDDLFYKKEFANIESKFDGPAVKLFDDLAKTMIGGNNCKSSHDSCLKIVTNKLHYIRNLTRSLIKIQYNEHLYQYEKVKIVHGVRSMLDIFTDQTEPKFKMFITNVKFWYENVFLLHLPLLQRLKQHLERYELYLKEFEDKIYIKSNENLSVVLRGSDVLYNQQKLLSMLKKHKDNSIDINLIIKDNAASALKIDNLLEECRASLNDQFKRNFTNK